MTPPSDEKNGRPIAGTQTFFGLWPTHPPPPNPPGRGVGCPPHKAQAWAQPLFPIPMSTVSQILTKHAVVKTPMARHDAPTPVRGRGDAVGFEGCVHPSDPLPLRDILSGCGFVTGPWTVSSLRMLRRVATFCRPLRPMVLLVSFPSAGPSSWRIGGCAGCCRDRFTVFAAHSSPHPGRPPPASLCCRGHVVRRVVISSPLSPPALPPGVGTAGRSSPAGGVVRHELPCGCATAAGSAALRGGPGAVVPASTQDSAPAIQIHTPPTLAIASACRSEAVPTCRRHAYITAAAAAASAANATDARPMFPSCCAWGRWKRKAERGVNSDSILGHKQEGKRRSSAEKKRKSRTLFFYSVRRVPIAFSSFSFHVRLTPKKKVHATYTTKK